MKPNVVLEIDGGYLRFLEYRDVHPGYIAGLNNPEVNRYLDSVKHTVQTVRSVVDFVVANSQSESAALFGIWQTDAPNHCGTVRLHGIDRYHKTAKIGICLFDKSSWGKGLGARAVAAVTRWAFDVLGLRWVEAGVYADNIASRKSFLRAGYTWMYDVPGKYLFEGRPATVEVFVAINATMEHR